LDGDTTFDQTYVEDEILEFATSVEVTTDGPPDQEPVPMYTPPVEEEISSDFPFEIPSFLDVNGDETITMPEFPTVEEYYEDTY